VSRQHPRSTGGTHGRPGAEATAATRRRGHPAAGGTGSTDAGLGAGRRGGRPAGRDRRSAGDQRRGVRARLRAEGRPVSTEHGRGLSPEFLAPRSSSFTEFLSMRAPELLPGRLLQGGENGTVDAPHGTTSNALPFTGVELDAGHGRAAPRTFLAKRDMENAFAGAGL